MASSIFSVADPGGATVSALIPPVGPNSRAKVLKFDQVLANFNQNFGIFCVGPSFPGLWTPLCQILDLPLFLLMLILLL